MISIEHLTYSYPRAARPVLRDISLHVRPGERVLLAGPSGAGKSTLLRLLNGLVPHFSGGQIAGRVRVAGLDPIAGGPPLLSRHVGFVFQNPEAQAVLDEVEAEVAFGLENAAVPPAEMARRVPEALEMVGLWALRKRPVRTLSGGERQRLAIASALVLRPQLLVLDEPTSQLDPAAADELLHTLLRLNEQLGLTIVLAEHRLERVLPFAERVVYLEDGRITLDEPVPECLPRLPHLPPVAELGRRLNWQPLPLTVTEATPWTAGIPAGSSLAYQEEGTKAQAYGGPQATNLRLEARGLHFAYGRQPALRGVDLQLRAGEAVALMGRNGSGKTTLLRCLVGLLRPGEGHILLDGADISGRDTATLARDVAYLPQNPDDLLFAETVAGELAATLRNHGRLDRTAGIPAGSIQSTLERLDLLPYAATYPRDLSVGQRQRVALGAVTVTRPGLLLLDEPTRGLDSAARQRLLAHWRRWLAEGLGLLLVTHDVELAAQIADRVMILDHGEVVAEGSAGDVLSTIPDFMPQMAQLFPGRGWLTVDDVLEAKAQMDAGVKDKIINL